MTAQPKPRSFVATDAATARKTADLPLLVGLMGCSGSGKTFTALRLATGIQSVVGGDIYHIDTEQNRALHYANDFRFKHVPFQAPYGSLDFLEALRFAKRNGAGVAIIDSCSHEHSGPGGYLDFHAKEVERLCRGDDSKYEQNKMRAWDQPAARRKALITALTTELSMPVIFCFRARETAKPVRVFKDGKMKTEVVDMGFTPIGSDDWIFEMVLSALLLPGCGGVPTWSSDKPGEKLAIKLPGAFEKLASRTAPLDEKIGRHLALWRTGGADKPDAAAGSGEQSAKAAAAPSPTRRARQPEPADDADPFPRDDGQPGYDLANAASAPTADNGDVIAAWLRRIRSAELVVDLNAVADDLPPAPTDLLSAADLLKLRAAIDERRGDLTAGRE